MELTLVVMAAGLGSRYGALKQVEAIGPGGEALLDYAVYDALRAGFGRVVFVIKEEMAEAFTERVVKPIGSRAEVSLAFQRMEDLPAGFAPPEGRVKPWGTGHAVLACRHIVNTPFAVINADDFYGRSAYQLLAGFLSKPPKAGKEAFCMAGYTLRNTLTENGRVSRGVCRVEGGKLVGIDERTAIEPNGDNAVYYLGDEAYGLDGGAIVSMNAWGFPPAAFGAFEERFAEFLKEGGDLKREFYLPAAVGDMVRDGFAEASVLPCGEKWYGVTYPQDKEQVRAAIAGLVRDGVYPAKLWA